ncbi:hypothetical protein JRQ81_003440 [Phrynocephalus forsythii]|uniref:B30.2/SPRY domain-containing protein n=1 Tax=Phrynocephalus forsythii TaxID=171643 RepID=A0A9Q1AXP2_9SAUR|nr:hypothetical protein JRQ81_003440 [Phrynocephalus forsythii]
MTPSGSAPILVSMTDRCNTSRTTHQWWERECLLHKEVTHSYQNRADIFRNGTLIIRQVELKDAGIYRAIIQTTGAKQKTTVNLTVMEGMAAPLATSKVYSWVIAAIHQTALLPLSFQPPSSSWQFISIKWERMTPSGSVPILVSLMDRCNTSRTIHHWWERECLVHKEVADIYQKRADIFRNGTLVIQQVELKDAGIYHATILTTDNKHEAMINLTVTGGAEALWKLSAANMIRMVLACLALCLLGLLVTELPHNQIQSCLLNCVPCRAAKDSITANLTLDPNTAFPQLYISKDLKNVKWKGMKQPVKKDTLRYDVMASVLSHEGFTSGKICWEVEVVEGGQWWGVGIVRESANRNGPIFLAPAGGYWGVQRIDGQYQAITDPRTNLSLCQPPTRIRVSLDYSEGLVAFFNGDTNEQLFAFPKATFSGERILAWFLIHGWNGELMIHP